MMTINIVTFWTKHEGRRFMKKIQFTGVIMMVLFIGAVLFVQPSCAASRALLDEDFAIGTVKLSYSRDKIVAILGDPSSIDEFTMPYFNGGNNVRFQRYIYPDIIVTVSADRGYVAEVSSTSRAYVTPRGVMVGDDLQKMFAQYGDARRSSRTKDGRQMVYTYTDDIGMISLSFVVNPIDGKITKVYTDIWSM